MVIGVAACFGAKPGKWSAGDTLETIVKGNARVIRTGMKSIGPAAAGLRASAAGNAAQNPVAP